MASAEGGEGSSQMSVGPRETMLATPRVESEIHTEGAFGVKKFGALRDFWLNRLEGLEGAAECLYVYGIMRSRFEVRPWREQSSLLGIQLPGVLNGLGWWNWSEAWAETDVHLVGAFPCNSGT